MKVLVKFSDLRKLKDENKFLKNRVSELNTETIRLDNALDRAIERERETDEKIEIAKYTTEEIKLLTDENSVLIEENNKLKVFTERKQPKFWFGDKVRILKNGGTFEINQISFIEDSYYYSRTGDKAAILETSLELIADENISK